MGIKANEILIHATALRSLENMLSERSKSQQAKHDRTPLILSGKNSKSIETKNESPLLIARTIREKGMGNDC